MKTKHMLLLFLVSVVLFIPAMVQSQFRFHDSDPTGTILPALQDQVRGQYGAQFNVYFAVLDSMIGNIPIADEQEAITDPYGTLKGAVFFWAVPDERDPENRDSVAVGMFKNGSIVWSTPPIYRGGVTQIYASRDLNNDGEVDLVTLWSPSSIYNHSTDIWIFSWNGSTGRPINDYNPEPRESNLVTTNSLLDIIFVDGDNTYRLRAYWSDEDDMKNGFPSDPVATRPWVTYTWDGTKYVLGSSGDQIPGNALLPANRLTIKTNCRISVRNNRFKYDYSFSSDSSSKQRVQWIAIGGISDSSLMYAPRDWETGGSRLISGRVFLIFDDHQESMIAPGRSMGGFGYESGVLPAIVNYYVQGLRPHAYNDSEQPISDETYQNDILTNSVIGQTLGTRDTSVQMNLISFVDTLASYTIQCRTQGWIKDQSTSNKYLGYFRSAKTNLQQNNVGSTSTILQQVLQDVNADSSSNLTSEAYALIRYNTEYLLTQLPAAPPPGLAVKLVNSTGTNLTGGSLQYYDGTWKDATNNNDGTFNIITSLKTLSLRMTYESATQTKSNVAVGPETVIFQTVNAQVKLQNSQGAPIDTGTVQYYFSSWKTLGTTTNGVASKELLPGNYTFRMTYASASNDKQQDIGANPVVLFQTVSASVQLKNSQGTLMDHGTVQYYFSSWKNFGVTTGGVVTKELLPGNYTFRMAYAAATNDKQQNISTNATVVFQTVNVNVQLQNSLGAPMDQGTVQYYFSSWNNFGSTSNGVAAKELLPGNYTFRMTYAAATNDKQQNIGSNATVVFQTVNASVQLKNSQGNFIDQGTVQYYFSSWNTFGGTSNGVASKELLPGNYTFRMTYESVSNDKVQNISTNGTVSFSTVLCTVSVKNSQSQPVDNAIVSYYSSTWKQIGPTVNGQVTKELLPANLTFKMTLGTASQDKAQNIATNALVEFVVQ